MEDSKMKLNNKKVIWFFIIFLLLFIFSMIAPLVGDEVWNFGFSYNTASGLLPYRDFNMVTLPFYQLLIALILKIFGKKIIIMNLFVSLLSAFILIKTNKDNYKNGLFLAIYMLLIIQGGGALFGYNTIASLILLVVIYLESIDYKYKNEINGIIISMVLMTKINLGLFMLIPYFVFSKNKMKSIMYLSIIPIIILVYLLLTNILIECFDFCFLGLIRFKDNLFINYILLIIELFIIGYLIYKYVKTKDKVFMYLIFYQCSLYPILDLNHMIIALLPLIYYVMYNKKEKIYNNIYVSTSIMVCIMMSINIFSNFNNSFIRSNDTFLTYKNIGFNYYYLNNINDYLLKNKDTHEIFIFSNNVQEAYLYKLYSGIDISKYDLILNGNMGSNAAKNITEIDNICHNKNCLFLIYEDYEHLNPQVSVKHFSYFTENYKKCDSIVGFDIYCNEIKK